MTPLQTSTRCVDLAEAPDPGPQQTIRPPGKCGDSVLAVDPGHPYGVALDSGTSQPYSQHARSSH
jgi:hypothetical protein